MFMLVITVDLFSAVSILGSSPALCDCYFQPSFIQGFSSLSTFFFFFIPTVQELRYLILLAEECVWAVFVCVKRPDSAGCLFVSVILMMIVDCYKTDWSAASG